MTTNEDLRNEIEKLAARINAVEKRAVNREISIVDKAGIEINKIKDRLSRIESRLGLG